MARAIWNPHAASASYTQVDEAEEKTQPRHSNVCKEAGIGEETDQTGQARLTRSGTWPPEGAIPTPAWRYCKYDFEMVSNYFLACWLLYPELRGILKF